MTKIRIGLLLILCLTLIATAICYHLWLSPAGLKAHVKAILQQYLSADITLGAANLSLRSGLTLESLAVRKTPANPPIFKASEIVISPNWLSLLKLKFRVRELALQNAELTFSKEPKSQYSWSGVMKERPAPVKGPLPMMSLTNGKITIGRYTFHKVNCEITPFPSKNLLAVRGDFDDPLWGPYTFSGNIDTREKTVRFSFETRDIMITEPWVRNFPFVGEKIWERYHPEGLFDFSGTVSYYLEDSSRNDFNLMFNAKDSSCRYLIFPITEATGRVFVDRQSVIINHLRGTMFKGFVEGYSLINMDAPYSFFNRYSFTDIDMANFLKDYQAEWSAIQGRGSGYASFRGDHSLGTFRGNGKLTIPDARLWKFPIILQILSKLQLRLWEKEEPSQECKIVFEFSNSGIEFKEITLVSDVFDVYGVGWAGYNGRLKLNFYVRPVSKTPLFIADLFLQPALDSLSGNIALFEVTGTLKDPTLKLIPLTPLSDQITNFFDNLSKLRLKR